MPVGLSYVLLLLLSRCKLYVDVVVVVVVGDDDDDDDDDVMMMLTDC